MMMPSMSPSSSSGEAGGGIGGAVTSSSAITRVDKATSEFLIGPDWTMNIDICDTLNSNHWLAKDVVRAVKKRLLHKNPKVQMLALTLLETMVKNCGDYVHFQIVDRNILQEMVKIVKKKTDMHVRDKMLVLLDSWQEAFGGPGGKYPQYYWAYEELRRFGVSFPQRSLDTAPIFTPPVSHPPIRHPQPGYGMPNNSSTRLDEAMASETDTLSLSSMSSMRDVLDLLADMLQAVNPTDRMAVKDEVIVDLVEQCRVNQKKLMQMLTTTGDEELLAQGLELNDNLQNVLAKHDAIASGLPLPAVHVANVHVQSSNDSLGPKAAADSDATPTSRTSNSEPLPAVPANNRVQPTDEEEEEEDDFALLARRHSKTSNTSFASKPTSSLQTGENNGSNMAASQELSSSPAMSNALVIADPPIPSRSTNEQDIIDLLSITLLEPASSSTTQPTAASQAAPIPSLQNLHGGTMPNGQGNNNSVASQAYLGNQPQTFNSYVAPWALPQQQQFQQLSAVQSEQQEVVQNPEHFSSQQQYSAQYYDGPQSQMQPPRRSEPVPQYSSAYPPPPWAATPGYFSNPNPLHRTSSNPYSSSQNTSLVSLQGAGAPQLQPHVDGSNFRAMNGDTLRFGSGNVPVPSTGGQKPFVPSYRLFEDLNVLGNSSVDGGRLKAAGSNSSSPSLSGAQYQSMIGGGKWK